MANTNDNASGISWAGGNTAVLNNNNRMTSNEKFINADAVQGALRVYVQNNGTPATGDYVDVWVAWCIIGGSFDTEEHAQYLGRINTVPAEDPGENPAAKTLLLAVSGKQRFKVILKANQGASRSLNVDVYYNEHRMA